MPRAWPLGLAVLLLAGCAEAPTIPQVHPLPEGRLSSGYGARAVDPVTGEAKSSGHHGGYDLAAAMGTPIRASKAGKVIFAGRKGGYGNAVILSHSGGFSTLYGHASRLAVEPGHEVEAGQVVAYVGSTGHSTGPHLHYELRYQGKPVDPGLFTASAPAPRRAKAPPPVPRSKPTPAGPTPSEPTPLQDDLPALLAEDAPPLRYPADLGVQSAMLALDGAAMLPAAFEPAEPPSLWERIRGRLLLALQKIASILSLRRFG